MLEIAAKMSGDVEIQTEDQLTELQRKHSWLKRCDRSVWLIEEPETDNEIPRCLTVSMSVSPIHQP